MATEWKGKSRGSVLGYKIFVFFIKNIGIRSAYFILYFVAFYFCFFAKDSTKSIYYYFKKRHQYTSIKSILNVFNSFYTFGQVLIDKIAISSGLRNKYTYEFDGIKQIKKILAQKKGGILISAHIGNFEIAQHFLSEIDSNLNISILTTDIEHTKIKAYLDRVTTKSNVKLILIKNDLSHIFDINAALARNEIICITGDRYIKGTKQSTETLLGKTATFPAGPFLLASRLKVPVLFVYVMREKNKHYHLYARTATFDFRDEKTVLKLYVKNLESMLKKYPLQWFNYFDFWNAI